MPPADERPSAPVPPTDDPLRRLFPLLWRVFVGAWLVFLVGVVASEMRQDASLARVVALSIWFAVVVSVWVWLMVRNPFRETEPDPAERQLQLGLLVAIFALIAYFILVFGSGHSWLFVYVLFAVGIALPTREAIRAIGLVVVAGAAVALANERWAEAVTEVPGVAAYGFAIVIVRRLIVTVRELEAARAEIVDLAAAEAVGAERLRIARDLHDLLGHSLSVIALKSELAGRLLPSGPERAAVEIADVERVARQSLREVREAVAGYRQPTLAAELRAARTLLAVAGVEARLPATVGTLPPAIDGVCAWTVREGVTNVVRHSRAHWCAVRLSRRDEAVVLEIADDGGGPPAPDPSPAGSGLCGLAERVAALGGDLSTDAGDGDGFVLRVALPLAAAPAAAEPIAGGEPR